MSETFETFKVRLCGLIFLLFILMVAAGGALCVYSGIRDIVLARASDD